MRCEGCTSSTPQTEQNERNNEGNKSMPANVARATSISASRWRFFSPSSLQRQKRNVRDKQDSTTKTAKIRRLFLKKRDDTDRRTVDDAICCFLLLKITENHRKSLKIWRYDFSFLFSHWKRDDFIRSFFSRYAKSLPNYDAKILLYNGEKNGPLPIEIHFIYCLKPLHTVTSHISEFQLI